jgi:hypothetical protein
MDTLPAQGLAKLWRCSAGCWQCMALQCGCGRLSHAALPNGRLQCARVRRDRDSYIVLAFWYTEAFEESYMVDASIAIAQKDRNLGSS